MRALIISDVHANLSALNAVLDSAEDYNTVWCLGDIVGYGPDPNECVKTVRELPDLLCIIGNHDAAALKQINADSFNPEAKNAILWTRQQLSKNSVEFLKALPETIRVNDTVTLTHGSPRHPVWEYLLDTHAATLNFKYFDTPVCFVGHTHLPVIYSLTNSHPMARLDVPEMNKVLEMPKRAIINPGSVGQPRDRDPRAAYGIYDSVEKTLEFRRVAYDVDAVQSRMREANLPDRHINRLSNGW